MSEPRSEPLFSEEFLAWSDEMSEIMDAAVQKALEENRRYGLDDCSGVESLKVAEPDVEHGQSVHRSSDWS